MKTIFIRILKKAGIAILILFILAVIYGYFLYKARVPKITFATTYSDTLAVLPIHIIKGLCFVDVEISNNGKTILFSAQLDTGNNSQCLGLSTRVWNYMEEKGLLGCDRGWLPPIIVASGIDHSYHWESLNLFQTYRVESFNVKGTDSLTRGRIVNEIKGIHLNISDDYPEQLGVSFLVGQLAEFSKKDSVLRFHKFIPNDYKRSVELKNDYQRVNFFYRYAMPVEVNGVLNYFFIDTGVQRDAIRLPLKDIKHAVQNLYEQIDSTTSGRDIKVTKQLVENDGNIVIGGKKYQLDVSYSDDYPSRYMINPFGIFDEDFLLDLAHKKIWFKSL